MPRKKIKRKHKHKPKKKFKHQPYNLNHKFNFPANLWEIYEAALRHDVLDEVVKKHLANSRIKDDKGNGLILEGDRMNNHINVEGIFK